MTARIFNADGFAEMLRIRAASPKLTTTEAAAAAGVSRAQYFRALHTQPINIQAFLSLCIWMGINPFAFLLEAETGRGLATLPAANVSQETATETRGSPRIARAA